MQYLSVLLPSLNLIVFNFIHQPTCHIAIPGYLAIDYRYCPFNTMSNKLFPLQLIDFTGMYPNWTPDIFESPLSHHTSIQFFSFLCDIKT